MILQDIAHYFWRSVFASVSVVDTGSVGTSQEHVVLPRGQVVYSKADDTFDQTHSWT